MLASPLLLGNSGMPFVTKGLHNRNRQLIRVSISTVYVQCYLVLQLSNCKVTLRTLILKS